MTARDDYPALGLPSATENTDLGAQCNLALDEIDRLRHREWWANQMASILNEAIMTEWSDSLREEAEEAWTGWRDSILAKPDDTMRVDAR